LSWGEQAEKKAEKRKRIGRERKEEFEVSWTAELCGKKDVILATEASVEGKRLSSEKRPLIQKPRGRRGEGFLVSRGGLVGSNTNRPESSMPGKDNGKGGTSIRGR